MRSAREGPGNGLLLPKGRPVLLRDLCSRDMRLRRPMPDLQSVVFARPEQDGAVWDDCDPHLGGSSEPCASRSFSHRDLVHRMVGSCRGGMVLSSKVRASKELHDPNPVPSLGFQQLK